MRSKPSHDCSGSLPQVSKDLRFDSELLFQIDTRIRILGDPRVDVETKTNGSRRVAGNHRRRAYEFTMLLSQSFCLKNGRSPRIRSSRRSKPWRDTSNAATGRAAGRGADRRVLDRLHGRACPLQALSPTKKARVPHSKLLGKKE